MRCLCLPILLALSAAAHASCVEDSGDGRDAAHALRVGATDGFTAMILEARWWRAYRSGPAPHYERTYRGGRPYDVAIGGGNPVWFDVGSVEPWQDGRLHPDVARPPCPAPPATGLED